MNLEAEQSSGKGRYPEVGSIEMRRKIGEEIRSAREFQQLTVAQISANTKIGAHYIESIEKGDWSFLPATYIKVFIRTVAVEAGLASKDIDSRLDKVFVAEPTTLTDTRAAQTIVEKREYKPTGVLAWAEQHRSILFYSLVAVLGVVFISLYLTNPSRSPERIAENLLEASKETAPQLATDTSTDTTTTSAVIPVESTPEPIIPIVETYQLEIYAIDTCYVKITQEDSIIYERTLWPRNQVIKELADPVKLSLGNAMGVRLIVDGDSLPPFQPGRRVRVARVGKDGFIS